MFPYEIVYFLGRVISPGLAIIVQEVNREGTLSNVRNIDTTPNMEILSTTDLLRAVRK